MTRIPINHSAHEEFSKIFDPEQYHATWIPQEINTLVATGSNDHIIPLSLFNQNSLYHRKNILIKEISGAGHFPWFEKSKETIDVFQEYYRKLINGNTS